MANIISYTRNLTKSIKYSAIDVMKDMNPVVTGFYNNNQSIFKETYRAIKDIKGYVSESEYSSNVQSKVGGLAKDFYTNLKEDLRSGEFYNRERIQRVTNELGEEMSGLDMDFGLEDVTEVPSSSLSNDSSLSFDDLDKVAEKSTNAVGEIMARTAQYQVEAQRQSTKTMLDQNSAIFGRLNSSIGAVNSNIALIVNYMKENSTIHYQNSRDYYENSTRLHQETNAMLKELLELEKNRYSKTDKTSKNRKMEFSDLFIDGALDLESYAELVKQNIQSFSGGMDEMISMAIEQGLFKSMTASPLKMVTDGLVKTVIPKVLKDSMAEFNKSLEGAFSSAIMKITGLEDSDSSILSAIGRMFGFHGDLKKNLDTSNYQKGAVPFDGVTRKAIIDVIPTYLSKIYSTLSGQEERRYNYDTGRYVKISDLRKELKQMFDSEVRVSTYDVQNSFRDMKKSVNFKGNKEREEQFDKDMKAFFDYYFKNAKLFNKKLKAKDYGMKGQYSEENLEILKRMWEALPNSMKLQFAGNIQQGRSSYNQRMRRIEEDSMNPIVALYNDFYDEETETASSGGGRKRASSNNNRRKTKRRKPTRNAKKATGTFNSKVDLDEKELEEISNRIYQDNVDSYYDKDLIDFNESFAKTKAGKKLNKPASIISNIFNKVDDYLYTFIFGDDKFDKDKEDNGFFNATINKMKESFEKFDIWLDENILNPIRSKFTKQNIHDAAQSFFGMFGIDLDTMIDRTKTYIFGEKGQANGLLGGFISDVKKDFQGVGKYIKDSFLSVFDYFGIRGKRNQQGEAKKEYRSSTKKARMDFEKDMRNPDMDEAQSVLKAWRNISRAKTTFNKKMDDGTGRTEPVGNAAEGINRVSKTGVIAVSEGELIIPPDLNPFNVRKRYKDENKAKRKFIDSIFNFAEGGTVGGKNYRDINVKNNDISDKQRAKNEETKNRILENFKKKIRGTAFEKPKFTKEDYEEGETPLSMKIQEEAINLIKALKGAAKGLVGDIKEKSGDIESQVSERFANATKDVLGNIRQYAPDMFTGGVLGGGVALATGMIGGPLLGVTAGIALSLIKDSEHVRTWLFGEQKDGEFEGGLLSKEISNNLNKYFPDMAKGATLGAITSIIPFVPGGPVTGIILGSAIGFAKNNEKAKEALFGEEGLLGPEFPERVKKTLPKMGLGALIGLVGGPFGVTTNVLLGSALGFASETETFKNIIFGEKDSNGDREGGLLGTIKENIVEPSIEFFKKMFKDFRDWFDKDIKTNVKKFIDPFNRQLQIFARDTFTRVGNLITSIINKALATPLGRGVKKITDTTHSILGGLAKITRGVVGAPFKALGRVGDRLRSRQIRKGEATYMSAAERLGFSKTKDFKKGIRGGIRSALGGDRYEYQQQDETLAGMDIDQLTEVESAIRYTQNANKAIKQDKIKVERNLKSLYTLIDRRKATQIKNLIITGQYEQAFDIIDRLPDSIVDKKGNRTIIDKPKIKELVESNGKRYKKALDAEANIGDITDQANKQLSKLGFKNDNKTLQNVQAQIKFLGGDKREKWDPNAQRTFEEIVNEEQKERHKEIVNKFNEVVEAIRQISDPDYQAKTTDDAKKFSKTVRNKKAKEKEDKEKQRRTLYNLANEQDESEEDVMDAQFTPIAASAKTGFRGRVAGKLGSLIGLAKSKVSNVLGATRANNVTESSAQEGETSGVLASELKDAQKEQKEDEHVKWDFSQGSPIKYIRSKDSNWHIDKSNSETVQTQRKLNEKQETQKGILNSITSLPGKIFSFFGGKKNGEEEQEEGFLSKMLKTAGKVAMIGALIAFAPKIVELLKTYVLPILSDVKDGFLAGWNHTGEQFDSLPSKIGSFFGEHLNNGVTYIKDFLLGEGKFEGKGFPYVFENILLPNALKGFEFLMSKVVPKAAEIIFKNLPSIIWSGVKGLGSLITSGVKKIFNPDGDRKDYDNGSSGSSIDKIDVDTGDLKYKPSSSWEVNGSGGGSGSGSGTGTSSMEERTENSKKIAGSAFNRGDKSVAEVAGGALTKAALTGRGAGTALGVVGKGLSMTGKATSKTIGKVPGLIGIVGKTTGAGLNASGKAVSKFGQLTDKTGELGRKIMPSGIIGQGTLDKANAKAAEATAKATEAAAGATDDVANAASKTTTKKAKGIKGKIGQKVSEVKGKIGQKISDVGSAAFDKVKSKAANLAKKENKGLIGKFASLVKKLIDKLFKNNKLINFVKSKAKNLGQRLSSEAIENSIKTLGAKLGEAVAERISKSAGKLIAKASVKIAAFVGTAGIGTIVFAVTGFISGWRKADEYLNIENPTFLQKLISGAITAINDSLCLGLIPIETLFDIVLSICEKLPMFKDSVQDIREQQAELQEKVDKFNLENNSNLTVDEYLAKDKFGTKVKNAVGGAVNKVKNFFGFGKKDEEEDESETGEGTKKSSKKESDTQKVTKEATEAMTASTTTQDEESETTNTASFTTTAASNSNSATQDATVAMMSYTDTTGTDYTSEDSSNVSDVSSAYTSDDVYTSIITTIPMYLSKIYSALTGQSDNTYTKDASQIRNTANTTNPVNVSTRSGVALQEGDKKSGIATLIKAGLIATPLGIPMMVGSAAKKISDKLIEESRRRKAAQNVESETPYQDAYNAQQQTQTQLVGRNMNSGVGSNDVLTNPLKLVTGLASIIRNGLTTQPFPVQTSTTQQNPMLQLNDATAQAVNNVNASLVGLTNNMESSLGVIDVEHQVNKKNLITANLKDYWKTKTANLGKGGDMASTLAHFITFYEKAMLFPMSLMNNALALSGSAITNGGSATAGSSTVSNSGGMDATAGTTANANISATTTTTTATTTTTSNTNTATINTGSSVGQVVSKAISGVKKFASGLWTGIKGLFGKGSGIAGKGSGDPIPKPKEGKQSREEGLLTKKINESKEKEQKGEPSVEEQDKINFYGLKNPSQSASMQKKKGYFVSQVDSPYSKRSFSLDNEDSEETVADAGCAPAAATMAINLANRLGNTKSTLSFDNAITNALQYKAANDGVTADYFIDEFARNNLSTAFFSGQQENMSDSVVNMLRDRRPVVLLGQNGDNTNKKNSPFGPEGHYVVATGISDDGKYIYINDPESKKPNMAYPINSVLDHVTIGMAPVPKNSKMDAKVRNAKIRDYMKQYRGMAPLAGSSNREKVWNYMRAHGYSDAAAAGVIGNLMYESGGGPSDIKLNAVEKGSGEGIGMVQWSGPRKTAFINFLNSRGSSWPNNDIALQCEYMLSELEGEQWIWTSFGQEYGSENHISLTQFKQCNDISLATTAFCANFERCHKRHSNIEKRIEWAKAAYNEFKGTGAGVVASSTPNVSFPKYNLTDDQINRIACTLPKEQVTEKGWSDEASLMANLTDIKGDEYATPDNLVKTITGSWFASVTRNAYHSGGTPKPGTVDIVKRVLVEGKRTMPRYVNEHDCFSDISYAANDGTQFEPSDRSKYQPNKTKMKNVYGSDYTFYRFPSDKDDPFGYTSEDMRSKWGDGYYDYSGSAVGSTNGAAGTATAVSTEPAWKNPKSITDLFTIFDDLAAAYGLVSNETEAAGTTGTTSTTTGGTAVGTGSEKQQALANSFIKSEGNIKTYSQDNRYDFTVADDGTITGNAIDCSAAVQKVYQKLIGVDPGSYTGAQADDTDLVTIETGSRSPGSDGPTISKMQLGDLVLYGSPGHVEMFTGQSEKGYTMGAGSAKPNGAPKWDGGTDVNGKLSDWHTQNQGFHSVRRWKGFVNGTADSTATTVAGAGSGLLKRRKRHTDEPVKHFISGKGSKVKSNSSKVERIIRKFTGKGTTNYNEPMPKISNSSVDTTSDLPVYNFTRSTDGTEVYETTVNNTNVSTPTTVNSNSEQLIEMLKAIVKILVRIVDNSDNMKQIVALLTQLVTIVSTTNDDETTSKEKKKADASALKLNLINTLNNATSSNPDKELIEIINNMESLASL